MVNRGRLLNDYFKAVSNPLLGGQERSAHTEPVAEGGKMERMGINYGFFNTSS